MREFVVDFVDMIKPVGGKRYMLVVMDRFSRWRKACPTKQKDAQSVFVQRGHKQVGTSGWDIL